MKEIIRYGFILGLICFLSSGVLVVVHTVTAAKISDTREKEAQADLKEVLPQCVDFKARIEDNEISYYAGYDTSGNLKGFAVKSEGKGYSSKVEVMAGLNTNLEIINVKILSQNETPGLGTKITLPDFLQRFQGKKADSLDDVAAISGATISSKAVIKPLKEKIAGLKEKLQK